MSAAMVTGSEPQGTSAAPADEAAMPIAAIHHDGSTDVDALLAAVADAQRRRGRRVRGLLMTSPDGEGCAGQMVLVDIATGDGYRVSQALGSGSASCRADTQGFARASEVLRRVLHEAADLVVINRFGSLEAEGGGFAAELLELMALGQPLLTAVATRHLDAWARFTGGGATLLPPQPAAVHDWLDRTLAAATAAR